MPMKLSTRLAIAMVGLLLFTAVAVSLLSCRNLESVIIPRALEGIESRARLLARDIEDYSEHVVEDLIASRSEVALTGMLRAKIFGGVDPLDGLTEETWRERLAGRLVAELAAKPSYYQIRLIGVEDGGREIVRVQRSGRDGAIRIVPNSELQRKGDRDYFTATIALSPGEVYAAPIDLNQELGAIEIPHVPVLRAATPVYTPDSRLFGIL